MAYARASKALGICDRCGFSYPLKRLQTEVSGTGVPNNLRVCRDCWDAPHPQEDFSKIRVMDPLPLRDPRPDSAPGRGLYGWNPVGNPAEQLEGAVGTVRVVA